MEEEEFIKWHSSLEEHCLYFDGASKGNHGVEGGGGVLLDPLGNIDLTIAWGLRMDTNNQAEILDLWQGINLAIERNVENLVVFGDFGIII
jgi:ribonuclease HI